MHQVRDAIELTLVPGIGTRRQNKLQQAFPETSAVFELSNRRLEALGLPEGARSDIRSRRYQQDAIHILDWARQTGCHVLTPNSPMYPKLLTEIDDPPPVLYLRGNLQCLQMASLAIVGTRRPSIYGAQMAERLAADLGERGFGIVSGLARGIDGAAHRGALGVNGKTMAILGCGIDSVYPREHRRLAQEIQASGTVLSEFPPGTPPAPRNFPVRNRVISGLALGTIIIEARPKSGSLITTRLALEQNREVFAVPGNVTTPQSWAPNFLIRQGAKLVQTWNDVVDELPPPFRQRSSSRDSPAAAEPSMGCHLTMDQEKLINLLGADFATAFDALLEKSNMDVSRLSKLLVTLELNGLIRQLPGNLYIRHEMPGR